MPNWSSVFCSTTQQPSTNTRNTRKQRKKTCPESKKIDEIPTTSQFKTKETTGCEGFSNPNMSAKKIETQQKSVEEDKKTEEIPMMMQTSMRQSLFTQGGLPEVSC